MNMRHFLLGVLVGVIISAVVLLAAVALRALRPVAKLPQSTSAARGDITVSVQEGYLGQLIGEMARKEEPMIQAVVVDVRPGERVDMILGLQMQILGQTLDLQTRLINTVQVEGARLRFDVQKMELAGMDIPLEMLPQSMRTTMETTVTDANAQANRLLNDNGLVPLSVVSDDSGITISLRAK